MTKRKNGKWTQHYNIKLKIEQYEPPLIYGVNSGAPEG
jgi:hypothetical protein